MLRKECEFEFNGTRLRKASIHIWELRRPVVGVWGEESCFILTLNSFWVCFVVRTSLEQSLSGLERALHLSALISPLQMFELLPPEALMHRRAVRDAGFVAGG